MTRARDRAVDVERVGARGSPNAPWPRNEPRPADLLAGPAGRELLTAPRSPFAKTRLMRWRSKGDEQGRRRTAAPSTEGRSEILANRHLRQRNAGPVENERLAITRFARCGRRHWNPRDTGASAASAAAFAGRRSARRVTDSTACARQGRPRIMLWSNECPATFADPRAPRSQPDHEDRIMLSSITPR